LSAILGALIGYEREYYHKAAGLRTHMLVCVGSALITLVSNFGFSQGDPTRIASSIITGIGFLGAGAIIIGKGNIKGLTTAATLWMVAGLGLAVGSGFYWGALMASALVIIILELNMFLKIK
jgi:putative Mg2+ transporter-C (MgtC) family protein